MLSEKSQLHVCTSTTENCVKSTMEKFFVRGQGGTQVTVLVQSAPV